MKLIITVIAIFSVFSANAQPAGNEATQTNTGGKANFIATINLKEATKDGIYMNGYVVNLPYEKIKELDGRTVRIKGKVTIVKGTRHYTDGAVRQGREEDSKHILRPKIRIVEDK